MSALGQKQTFAVQNGMSALPPKADIRLNSRTLSISTLEHITLRAVGCLIAELKIQIFQVNLAALFSEHSRVKAPRLFWANLYEIPNGIGA